MSLGWRFLIVIYNLLIIAVSGIVVAMSIGRPEPVYYLDMMLSTSQYRMIAGLVAVVVIVIGLFGIVAALKRHNEKEIKPVNQVLVQNGFDGEVYMSLEAIKVLINRAVKKLDGTREVDSKIVQGPDGLVIDLHSRINPELAVPELSKAIQSAVKDDLEKVGGLQVAAVNVMIEGLPSK
ncbi:MAG: alkaline shock response membrane anchor protein AmaP [Syntrophomonadaceae bacterium]|nr:alkaline shock response membrane anchor protein AmaP [Syntrophomonadaceae bacterium]